MRNKDYHFLKNLCFQVQYIHIKAVDTNILMCECTITTSSSVTDYNIAGCCPTPVPLWQNLAMTR